jgi:hypothetical protein
LGTLKRCSTCGQLVDWDELAEAVHHGRRNHKPMPGFTDDRAMQGELVFEPPNPAGWAAHLNFESSGIPLRDARKGRRKKSSFSE